MIWTDGVDPKHDFGAVLVLCDSKRNNDILLWQRAMLTLWSCSSVAVCWKERKKMSRMMVRCCLLIHCRSSVTGIDMVALVQ